MKFTRIELENIFAYAGRVVLDVSSASHEKNIILVWGRNGTGKTSLLNAVKLLFLGAEDQRMRSIGFPRRVLGQRQFVLGDGPSWSGVINRRAIHHDPDSPARIKLNWQVAGQSLSAERRWRSHGAGYQESLVVYDGNARLTAAVAEQRLQDFLPRDFVDFFFFDGEEIKALAEMAEGRKAVDFDRVLRTTFISELASELSRIARERQRALLSDTVRNELAEVEGEIRKAEAARSTALEQISGWEEQLVDNRREQSHLLARRENLRSGASSAEREELEHRREELKSDLVDLTAEVCTLIPSVAPMIVNPGLVDAALAELDERLNATGSTEERTVRRIQSALPSWLTEGPPKLDKKTSAILTQTLSGRLDLLLSQSSASGLFANLDSGRATRIREMLLRFSRPEQRRAHYQLLMNTRRARLELERITGLLMELEVGSEATLAEYRDITNQLERVENDIDRINQEIGQQKRRLAEAETILQRKSEELKRLERANERVTEASQDARYISRLARCLNDLREELRRTLREQVMVLINEKFQILVHDHHLVHTINLDDTYTLTFRDGLGRPVGRSSLSSGIKQLAATALLWAMKEVPQHDVPVIIDTPLGRIDRENQEHMLLNYYPSLADQVIVLPTNAEIDERKYELIRHRVAKEYVISNETGDGATVTEGSLVK